MIQQKQQQVTVEPASFCQTGARREAWGVPIDLAYLLVSSAGIDAPEYVPTGSTRAHPGLGWWAITSQLRS